MGKKLSFLGFLTYLFVFAFSANSFAGTCTYVYDSCNAGYYLDNDYCEDCPNGCTCAGGDAQPVCCGTENCPSGYTDGPNTYNSCNEDPSDVCYADCDVSCIVPPVMSHHPDCPDHATCSYDTSYTYEGRNYYDIGCDIIGNMSVLCPVDSFGCDSGYYIDGDSCEDCPDGCTCAGGTAEPDCPATGCSADEYLDDGVCYDCPNDYPYSSGGEHDITYCYRDCDTSDVDNSTDVDGIYYYDDYSTCEATACSSGYYLDDDDCTSCTTVSCGTETRTQTCDCTCSVTNGTCSCTNGEQSYEAQCYRTGGAGGTNGAAQCTGTNWQPIAGTYGTCEGDISITCNQNYYLDNDACSGCPNNYPYTASNGQTSISACYTACTTADVTGSTGVQGNKYADDTNECSATSCDSNHCLANGAGNLKVCVELPANGYCTGNPDDPIDCDPGYTLNNGSCVANTYNVTYSCGDGSGSVAGDTATYGASFTTDDGSSCTKTNYVFVGWMVSGTNDVKQGGETFTWGYIADKTLTAKYQETANNCGAGEYYNGTTCESCPTNFPYSDAGSAGADSCYAKCNTPCVDPGKPANAYSAYFDLTYYESRQYVNDNECRPVDTKCAYTVIVCNTRYYLASESCLLCPQDTYPWTNDGGINGISSCHRQTTINCSDLLPAPTHAVAGSCTYENVAGQTITKINAGVYYPDTIPTPYAGLACYMSSCDCDAGYVYQEPEPYDDTDPGACVPGIFTITLDDNGGSGGSGTIYEKYTAGWYSNSGATNNINSVTQPTWTNHSFIGYYDAATGGNLVIPSTGSLPSSSTFTADTTLYAHWTEDNFVCTAGKTSTGTNCPAGSYCPGGEVPAAQKDDPVYGCSRTCPTDASGGTVTSVGDRTSISQCQTTRTNVALTDSTGAGNQTCYYDSTATNYSKDCTIAITSCVAGRYREGESSITCAVVGRGAYSPDGDITRYLCSSLTGADSTVTTDGDTSAAATACYNTCSDISIANGSRVTTNEKEFYNGTQIPACTYTTTCNTGYGASGETCTPNVYEITLNHDNAGCTSNCTVPTSPIYLKYNTGWYASRADAEAGTNAITSVTVPNWPGKAFSGYFSISDQQVIDANGNLTAQYTVFAADATVTASWEQKPVVSCVAGTYYTGTGTTCTDCPAGSYCGGTNPIQDIGVVSGIEACPTAANTYTAATDANGDALTVTITSPVKSTVASDCYATNVAYTASQGAGSQTCHYNTATAKYADNCTDIQILTCTTGHWLATSGATDCAEVTAGYYSPDIVLTRTECPNRGEDNTITTQGTTSGAVTQCYRGNIWYEPTNGHSGHRRNCYHKPDETDTNISTGYTYNCDVSVIVTCDAGYYDDGTYTNGNNERDCTAVGKGYFSPAQSACTGEPLQPSMSETGCSTQRTQCPAGTGVADVTSTTPDTETTTSGSITACYLTCNATKNLNGTIVNVVNSPVHYNTTKNAYDICRYDSNECPQDMWCDEEGFHDCPSDKDGTPGKADLVADQKYRPITTCYVLYNPFVPTAHYDHTWGHGSGWVKAFYEGTETDGDYTNYYNVGALTCDAGYYYDAAMTCSAVGSCQYSPAQSAFPNETPTMSTPGSSIMTVACPAGCSGSELYASSYTQCYKACDLTTSDFAHSQTVVPVSDTVTGASATTYNACEYNITCVTGYDVQNNGSTSPSCTPHEYTITLDKNGGSGSTPASVNCVFDSGSCALPAITDTRTGYSTASKWCTEPDGSGTCYDAGTTVTTNISANASDKTLYAQWTPNIYTVQLDDNGAATAGAPATVYLKYATGWYSNANATTPITTLTTIPVKGVLTFAGYSGNSVTVIGADGKFATSTTALTFTTENATVMAQWTDAPITCPAGTYYVGSGEDPTNPNVCKACTADHYCPGTTVQTNSGEAGLNACPDGGKSPTSSSSATACYKELLPTYVADHGKGTQTCYYDETALTYSDRCKDFVITTCDAGYWLATSTDVDCSAVGVGYYSADIELTRTQCPNGGTTMQNNTTAETVYECYKTGLDYAAVDGSGTGTQSCWYSSGEGNSAVYGRDCFDKTITACRGGYYLANNSDIVCSEVGLNNYSEEGDIARHACADNGKTRGTTTDSAELCYKDGLEYIAEHGGGSQTCYWSIDASAYNIGCGDKKITYCDGGYYLANAQALDCVAVGYNAYSPNLDLARYNCPAGTITLTETSASETDCFQCPEDHVCNPDIGDKTCSEMTNGQYPKSDAGTGDVAYCYAECALAENAASMTGRDYNGIADTCEIVTCQPGYSLSNGQCVVCPENDVCNPDIGTKTCSELTNGEYTMSDAGTSDVAYCYRNCAASENAATMTGRDYYSAPDTCEITSCDPGYYMSNGQCVLCPAGSVCNPDIEIKTCSELTNGQYTMSDEGTSDATYCYRDCTMAQNANAMAGRDYNGAPDTCEITSCVAGYSLSNGQCVTCPAGSYCDGTPGDDGDGAKLCSDLGDGSWMYSAPGSTKASDCYRSCIEHTEDGCLLTPIEGRAYWPNNCQYTATINGNPADIVDGVCVVTGCLSNYELIDGNCEPCNRENAISYKAEGNCMVESCTIGYHPNKDQCESDTLECTPQAPHSTYAEQKWIAAHNAYGICTIKTCMDGYHLASNACVSDEQVCEIAHGTGMKTWDTAAKAWGPCVATSCVPGYTNDPAEKNNASEQCSECRNKFSRLGEVAVSSYTTGCEIASCLYQGEKYNLDNNECVPICDQPYSDETGSLRWNDRTKKCERTCNPGYMSW